MPYTFVRDFGSFKIGDHVAEAPADAVESGSAVAVKAPVVMPVVKPVTAPAARLDGSRLDAAQPRSGELDSKVD